MGRHAAASSSTGSAPLSMRPDHERVDVGVRQPRDLPEAELLGVVLPRREVAEGHEVGLGLEAQHGDAEVVAEAHRLALYPRAPGLDVESGADPPRACTKNPSKTGCTSGSTSLMYRVSRNADCDSPIASTRSTPSSASTVPSAPRGDRTGLRVHVERVPVARVRQRAVALGVGLDQAIGLAVPMSPAPPTHRPTAPTRPRTRTPSRIDLAVQEDPVGGAVEPPLTLSHSTTTVPLKRAGVGGSVDHDAGAVVGVSATVATPSLADARTRRRGR